MSRRRRGEFFFLFFFSTPSWFSNVLNPGWWCELSTFHGGQYYSLRTRERYQMYRTVSHNCIFRQITLSYNTFIWPFLITSVYFLFRRKALTILLDSAFFSSQRLPLVFSISAPFVGRKNLFKWLKVCHKVPGEKLGIWKLNWLFVQSAVSEGSSTPRGNNVKQITRSNVERLPFCCQLY